MPQDNTKKIFSYGCVENTAYLNWRTERYDNTYNFTVLGDGFSQAAIILMDEILKDNFDKKADVLIFPIFYDVDQSIEMYIKAIINVLNVLSGDQAENFKIHDIKELYNQMKSRIKKYETNTSGLEKYLKPLKTYIDELYEKIDYKEENLKSTVHIDFARYPVTTEGTQHFYIRNNDNEVVDIDNLKQRYIEVIECLEGLYDKYSNTLFDKKKYEDDMRREAQDNVNDYY